jgi:hypothetical protein
MAAVRLVAVSSIVREGLLGSPTGYLRIIDLDTERTLYCGFPPESVYTRDDPNPRGGSRGTKGISACPGRVAVAVAERVSMFDDSWRLLTEVSHPWFGLVHGLLAEPDGVWVTATACDLLIKLSWEGEVVDSWFWGSDSGLRRAIGFGSLPEFDSRRDYRDRLATGGGFDSVHLTAVARGRDGLILNFGQVRSKDAVRRNRRERLLIRPLEAVPAARPLLRQVRRRRSERPPDHGPDGRPLPIHSFALVLLPDRASVEGGDSTDNERRSPRVIHRRNGVGIPNHDVLETGNIVLYNDTNANDLVALDPGGEEVSRVRLPGEPGFARGLAWLGGNLFLAGNESPASLHTVDMANRRVVSSISLDGPPKETVFSIAVLPGSFGPPPPRLPGFEPEPSLVSPL